MLKTRILRVSIALPGGDVVLNEELSLFVNIKKNALLLQNKAVITVFGLSKTLREQLLSQFTAWNKRKTQAGDRPADWIAVEITAGYRSYIGNELTSVIFRGEVALVSLLSGPPDIGVSITCFSRQIDKTADTTMPVPTSATLEDYVKWVAQALELGNNYICDTSQNKTVFPNPAYDMNKRAALLVSLQDFRRPDIVAYIDDNYLYVKDLNKIINPSEITSVTEFVGIPSWNEYGVEFETLFDTGIKLAHAASLQSIMNPSVNGKYVIISVDYNLASRDEPFYVKAFGAPPSA